MKTLVLAAVLSVIFSISIDAQETATFDGDMITYRENGQTFNFRKNGEKQLMLMPGTYYGFVVIPAGIDTDDGLYTVTAIGPGALTGKSLTGVVIPHTVTTLDHPFGEYTFDYSPLDSIKFLDRPLHFYGAISKITIPEIQKKKTIKPGEQITRYDRTYTVKDIIVYPHLLVVEDKEGKIGAITYDGIIIFPFEYDDMKFGCRYAVFAKKRGKWGVVDYNINVLIPFTNDTPDYIANWDKRDKKIGRAFHKFYKGDDASAIETIDETFGYIELKYLLWISGYQYEKKENDKTWSDYDIETIFNEAKMNNRIDSLTNCGEKEEAKALYREYVQDFGFSSGIEEAFGKAGYLTYMSSDTTGMSWDDGYYSGQVDEFGIPHGNGVLDREEYPDYMRPVLFSDYNEELFYADHYEGKWIKGKVYGPSKMVRNEVYLRYQPEWSDTIRIFSFSGYLAGYKAYGKADLEYPVNSLKVRDIVRYSGEVSSSWERNGKGKAWTNDGGIFEGEWKDDELNGYAKASIYPNAEQREKNHANIYEGFFEDGRFISGKVVRYYLNGVYSGEWAENNMNGHGIFTEVDGRSLEGNFRDGLGHGEFTITEPDGSTYQATIGKADYLTVNGKDKVTENISHNSTSRSYKVTTDWNRYEISGLPDWITVRSRTADSFTLNFADNTDRHRRTASVTVSAGYLSVTINVTQEGDIYTRTGTISNSWTKFGATRGYGMYMTQGIEVHTKFSLDNLSGKQCQIIAYFEFSNGQKLRDINSNYGTTDGYVATYENFTPPYTSTLYNDYCLYIPYNELHMAPGQHQLRYYVCIFDMTTGKAVAKSDYIYFTLTTW